MSRYRDDPEVARLVRVAGEFRRPAELIGMLEPVRARIPREDLFNDPALKVLKETWHAGVFGLGFEAAFRVAVEVRITEPEPFPDFQLQVNGSVLDFEQTTARQPGLGRMHKGDRSLGPPKLGPPTVGQPPFDPAEVIRVVRRKADRSYAPPSPHLLVLLMLSASGITAPVVREAVRAGKGDAFASVWVMTPTHVMCALPWEGLAAPPDGWWKMPLKVHES